MPAICLCCRSTWYMARYIAKLERTGWVCNDHMCVLERNGAQSPYYNSRRAVPVLAW